MSDIIGFENFMKNARWAQPLHRGALATDTIAPVTAECDPKALVLPPQLQKEKQLEALQRHTLAPQMAPSFGPGGTSMQSVPNLNLNNLAPPPPKDSGKA